ncbi:MAG: molybdopterin molybdotransferase MoeA [Bellilinea sp.]
MTDSPLLPVKDVKNRILAAFYLLPKETIALMEGNGRVLAEDVAAGFDLPPFDNSGMDGFALHPADRPESLASSVELAVVADIPAGMHPAVTLKPGQAARIMTGAPLPEGADCVVPVEDTDFPYRETKVLPESVRVNKFPPAKSNIRPRGQDAAAGEVLLQAGQVLLPASAALLASLGHAKVSVRRQPKIAILSTGDELIPPGTALTPGKIYESNSTLLGGLTERAGAVPQLLGIASDSPAAIQDKLEQAITTKSDLILTSAGVSVGAFDFVRQVIEDNGKLELWRVNMRPGKPLAFGHYKSTPVIGLPGNPVSAFAGFMVFVAPVIRKMLGLKENRMLQKARLEHPIHSDGRESYLRAEVRRDILGLTAHLNTHQGSANLLSIVRSNALLIVPSGVKSLPTGAEVEVWLLSEPE